jgi:hypothetical protein
MIVDVRTLRPLLLSTVLHFILFTIAVTAAAHDRLPVKLTFEQAGKQAITALLNNPGTPEIIVENWQAAHEKFDSAPPTGKIAKYDLNGDETEEVFLYLSGHGLCGRGGCHLIIFKFDVSTQRFEYKTVRSSSDDILVLDSQTEGYQNLAIRLTGDASRREKGVKMNSENLSGKGKYTFYFWKDGNLVQTDKTIYFQSEELYCD